MINLNFVLYISVSLLCLTSSAVLAMHSFSNSYILVYISGLLVTYTFGLWFRDIISEGTTQLMAVLNCYYTLMLLNFLILYNRIFVSKDLTNVKVVRVINEMEITNIMNSYSYKEIVNNFNYNDNEFSYYLAGLLEGDGYISLPALGNTTLNRILNPRLVFTFNINNLPLFVFIKNKLEVGRFQQSSENVGRYIIGDYKGIIKVVELIHGKLRTPKNITFNKLIDFLNLKYNINIAESPLDTSQIGSNYWFTGFIEADGYFGVKIVEAKPKLDNLRSRSRSVGLVFRLDQRLYDKPTSSNMASIMESLAKYLDCTVSTYKIKEIPVLSVSISSITKIELLMDYISKFPLLGVKGKDYKDWEKIYTMIKSKEHLTDKGFILIKTICSNMNKNRKI